MSYTQFRNQIWTYYQNHGRDMPWRINKQRGSRAVTPYCVLVSELMLQQTQVSRVIPKYKAFLKHFPSFKALAHAPTREVLTHWQGLGYNRRAINLKRTAEITTNRYAGRLPTGCNELLKLPGIGPYTASAVQAFAFNKPSVCIETNIRTVFFHHFFSGHGQIHDAELYPLIEQTLDHNQPREWYYALMDYGAHLKQRGYGANKKSKHYTKQSRFKGSNREQRSRILRYLLSNGPTHTNQIAQDIKGEHSTVQANVEAMTREGLLEKQGARFQASS